MTTEGEENFERSTKCWICENTFIERCVKVRDQCHVTRKYRGASHRDCDINVSLNYKFSTVFHNLKNYDAHFIMQEFGIFNFKIRAIPKSVIW